MRRIMVGFLYCMMLSIAVATQVFAVPAVTSFTLPIYSNRTVPISSFTVSDNATLVSYCITESDNSTPCNWLSAPPTSYYLSSGGSKILYAFVKDAAGNISPSVSAMVTASNAILPPPGLLPKTGQTTSYAAGDDGDLQKGVAWPDPRFTDLGDGTVGDNLTGLIWSKDLPAPTGVACGGGEMSWQEALDYITCLNSTAYLGHSDWLLPNINELKSLLPLPAGHPFTEGDGWKFWSSSSFLTWWAEWAAWFVCRSGRTLTPDDFPYEQYSGYVWPIRGGRWSSATLSLPRTGQTISYAEGDDGALRRGVAWPYPRFSEKGDGTVRDNLTGLIWLKDLSCFGLKVWSDALSNTNLMASGSCGLSDGSVVGAWRMPNRAELISLIDISQRDYALPEGHPFIGIHDRQGWSSSSAWYNYPWVVYMSDGYMFLDEYAEWYPADVWAVRGGEWADLTLAVTGDGTGNVTTAGGVPFALTGVSGKETYEQGEMVTLQATPVSGSIFVGWSGACSGPGSCVVTMDSAKEVSANFALDMTKLTVTPNLMSPQRLGATIIFTAAASGGKAGPYEYRFWWRSALAGSMWRVGQVYSTNPIWNWNTAILGLPAGNYFIQVDTRHVGNPVKREAIKSFTYKLEDPVLPSAVTLTANLVTPQPIGTMITFTGNAIGGNAGPYEYRFWWRSVVAGSTWTVGQTYSTRTSWNWNTASLGLPAGSYYIQVDTRHVGNTAKSEAKKILTYTLVIPLPTPTVTLTANLATPQPVGTTITFIGKAISSDAGPYEYRFWWRSALVGSTWTVGQAYSLSTTWKWNTAILGLPAGSYYIQVDTRHVGNPVKREAIKSLIYKLVVPLPPSLLP